MIRDEVVLKLKDERLATFSVFIPMVPGDGSAPAEEAAKAAKAFQDNQQKQLDQSGSGLLMEQGTGKGDLQIQQ